jgi:hypothetical protein
MIERTADISVFKIFNFFSLNLQKKFLKTKIDLK